MVDRNVGAEVFDHLVCSKPKLKVGQSQVRHAWHSSKYAWLLKKDPLNFSIKILIAKIIIFEGHKNTDNVPKDKTYTWTSVFKLMNCWRSSEVMLSWVDWRFWWFWGIKVDWSISALWTFDTFSTFDEMCKFLWGDVIGVGLSEKFSLKILGWCYPSKITHECNCHYHFAVVVNSPLWMKHLWSNVILWRSETKCYTLPPCYLVCWMSSDIVLFDILACLSRIMIYAFYIFDASMGRGAKPALLMASLLSFPFKTCLCSVTWATGGHRVTVH